MNPVFTPWPATLAGACAFLLSSVLATVAQIAPAPDTLPAVTIIAPPPQVSKRTAPVRSERRAQRARPASRRPARAASSTPTLPAAARGDVSAAVTALPAATTVLDAATIARAPVATYGDLFRSLPGFNVSNFGQGAVGYGLSLRGYTEAEHGRDIAYFIDGVPVNEVSSLHTPNYADLNILIPETVKSIEVIRGPFSVEYGDSNLGGSVNITTKESEAFGTAEVSGGTQGTVRGVATYSTTQNPATPGAWLPYLAIEGYRTDGYRDNSFIDRYNAFSKITTTLPDGASVSLRAQAYGTTFGAPGYANRDAIETGLISERSATNRTDGGDKQLENLVANYSSGASEQELKGALFVNHDYFNRYADFGGGQLAAR